MANLSKITLPDGNTYDFKDDVSGYSKVSVNRKTASGTNIADITIDGATTQLYAPSGGGSTPNDGTLTIQRNGTTVQTFSANQGTNVTADITVPTDASEILFVSQEEPFASAGVGDVEDALNILAQNIPEVESITNTEIDDIVDSAFPARTFTLTTDSNLVYFTDSYDPVTATPGSVITSAYEFSTVYVVCTDYVGMTLTNVFDGSVIPYTTETSDSRGTTIYSFTMPSAEVKAWVNA